MPDCQRGIRAAHCDNMPLAILGAIQMMFLFMWAWPAIAGQCMIACMSPAAWVPSFEDRDNAKETKDKDRG